MKKISMGSMLATLVITGIFSFSLFVSPLPVTAADGGQDPVVTTENLPIKFDLHNPLKTSSTLPEFLGRILDTVVLFLMPVIVIMLLWTGFLFIKAQGNSEELDVAKRALMYTLIGAIIVLGAKGFADALEHTVNQF